MSLRGSRDAGPRPAVLSATLSALRLGGLPGAHPLAGGFERPFTVGKAELLGGLGIEAAEERTPGLRSAEIGARIRRDD